MLNFSPVKATDRPTVLSYASQQDLLLYYSYVGYRTYGLHYLDSISRSHT